MLVKADGKPGGIVGLVDGHCLLLSRNFQHHIISVYKPPTKETIKRKRPKNLRMGR